MDDERAGLLIISTSPFNTKQFQFQATPRKEVDGPLVPGPSVVSTSYRSGNATAGGSFREKSGKPRAVWANGVQKKH
jgi:hypothetical protein